MVLSVVVVLDCCNLLLYVFLLSIIKSEISWYSKNTFNDEINTKLTLYGNIKLIFDNKIKT